MLNFTLLLAFLLGMLNGVCRLDYCPDYGAWTMLPIILAGLQN
jgi:hypothetical protein